MERKVEPLNVETVPNSSPGDSPSSGMTPVARALPEEGRFVPGTLLAGRYRIIGLLGRGGMGEVYRATDLTLGQSVALKFLPAETAANQWLLERFHSEVRVARQVSHPNVCRVYDIGQAEGMPFISMEYVDGEDLASLLRRIGRVPSDKAIETARKLCAGLAAAHERGVIHRDLKPQNIMINKRGEVVVMDFGLAAVADQLSGSEARDGTPAYMAPEQLKGSRASAGSDIYALGLVLYELFTGKKPYEAQSAQQLIDLQESAQLTSMTSIAADIDPAVERAIRRCLDPDPAKRPATALAVSAALPGGDPLAAALAAGETPSPELVAAAGKAEGLPLRYSLPCLALVAFCLFGAMLLRDHSSAMTNSQLDLSPEVLRQKAREIAVSLGYPTRPRDSELWLQHRSQMIRYLRELPAPRKWEDWLAAEAPIQIHYRESPSWLVAEPFGEVSKLNPAPVEPGMLYMEVDGHGRLLSLSAAPYKTEAEFAAEIQPETVFRAAGFEMTGFTETVPSFLPLHASDRLRAWKGSHPKIPNTDVTVELAYWRHRVTHVQMGYPWTRAMGSGPGQAGSTRVWRIRGMLLLFFTSVGGLFVLLLARRNWKLGRMDRKGALRLAVAKFFLGMVVWLGTVHPVPDDTMIFFFLRSAAEWLMAAALIWLLYLALEPALRARWPHSITTWNRVLAGRWKDAQVGAHILIGSTVGAVIWTAAHLIDLWKAPTDWLNAYESLHFAVGTRQWVAGHIDNLNDTLSSALIAVFTIFCLRMILKKDLLSAIAAAALFMLTAGEVFRSTEWQITAAMYLGIFAVLIFILLRLGLVATFAAMYFIDSFNAINVGMDWKRWYAPAGLATAALLLGFALFAFWRALGWRNLLGGEEAAV